MAGHRKFSELLDKMPAARRAEIDAGTKAMMAELPLHELRAARGLTQEHLARILHIKQSNISKLERRTDLYVSTLADFIRAMGGELQIRAVFPDGVVAIKSFGEDPV